MARTLNRKKVLPSLLDRLTDDSEQKRSINAQQDKIKSLERRLPAAQSVAQISDQEQQQILHLHGELEQAQLKYHELIDQLWSLDDLRECVKRDLDWLLNARYYVPQEDLEPYPETVAQSVLNYGIPDLTGKTSSGFGRGEIAEMLKHAISRFEPRIIEGTLEINSVEDRSGHYNMFSFEIEGELKTHPLPTHLHLKTEIDLENGSVAVVDALA